jgi:hypothetical protein
LWRPSGFDIDLPIRNDAQLAVGDNRLSWIHTGLDHLKILYLRAEGYLSKFGFLVR